MARPSRGANRRSTWSIAFYLLLVLVGGLMMAKTARADDQKPIKTEEDTGVSGPVIGIDLGTTYSCVGIMKNGKVEIMVNDQGNRITPSWVAFTDEERLVGDAAKNQYASNPHRTIFDVVSNTLPATVQTEMLTMGRNVSSVASSTRRRSRMTSSTSPSASSTRADNPASRSRSRRRRRSSLPRRFPPWFSAR